MIAKLFRRLTADREAGTALFDWATARAREREWYVDGAIADTIDGRFAVLSTIVALCCLRLERLSVEGDRLSVAVTERFADVMESEHRELGIGDPTLGKTVLKLVGALARRVEALRPAMTGDQGWAAGGAIALPSDAADGAIAWRARRLEALAGRLRAASLDELASGDIR